MSPTARHESPAETAWRRKAAAEATKTAGEYAAVSRRETAPKAHAAQPSTAKAASWLRDNRGRNEQQKTNDRKSDD